MFHLGTAIDKPNQRAMMAAQPSVLSASVAIIRAVDADTAPALAGAVLTLCQWYNKTMSLRIEEHHLAPTT